MNNNNEFINWLTGAFSQKGLELSTWEKELIKSKLPNSSNSLSWAKNSDFYVTIHKTNLWKVGESFSCYSPTEENTKSLRPIIGELMPRLILVENSLNPQNNKECSCSNLRVSQQGDSMTGLPKAGPGIINVGNSFLVC